MKYYVGILDYDNSIWGGRLPDIDGCVGCGETPELAITNICEALREVAAYKGSKGFKLQEPSSLATIIASQDIRSGESTVMIPLLLDAGRTVKANLTFDAGLLDAIDATARQRGLTRSAFLASAARDKIQLAS